MVDKNLIEDIKEMRTKEEFQPSYMLKIVEYVKQIGEENKDVKEELENMTLKTIQFVMTDVDYKFWVKIGEGKVEYAEGESRDANVKMKATVTTWGNLETSKKNSNESLKRIERIHHAYVSGNIQIEGNLQDAIAYSEFLRIAMKEFPFD
ncbi:MAG: SCP2 sterol-binding domain-containing protein [Promethearchaeota archaeon]